MTDHIFLFEPLALEYLGAGLKLDGHEVRLLDARLEPDIEGIFCGFQPDMVGLTGFTSHVNIVKGIAARLKSISPDLLVVAGGHHATVRPEDFNDSVIDVVVVGEGVFTLREIVHAVESESGFREIAGLAIPCPDGMLFTEPRPYTDLNALPFPDRTLTASYRKQYFSEWFKPLASIRTSLGCTARCNFCALWGITGGKYLRRDPAAVLEELKTIAEPNIFFCDDESMCDTKRMDRLADMIREAGIKKNYFLYGRVDTIVKHPELLAKWAKIGLSQVFVGMEDFSEARLNAMNKGVTTAQQVQAAKILDDLGIMMYASFMVDPAYSRDDFRSLVSFVRRLKLKYATFTVMTPLPGTELYAERRQDILSHKPELYDMLHALLPTTLPLEKFYCELADLYTKAVPFYRVLPALLRFGLHGMLLRIRLFGRVLAKIRTGHLDY
jgi:radical SAM superfamily enzyme YgiQ (UPF0313 family)